ncbi:alpha/beta hydrolase [Rhodococcus koreensis]|uniref:alpha/beta hydrolase n=1 Tax=Rhodococcus sp. T2V TaxID=3034164 RepID=UPI0023E1A62E|nr:alpha/beta hydrolase [Rhodococcus sp. T2V]MDF3312960.1 alpha/beta hydrolase [Rhodococcus sp. T2V]
MPLDAAVQSLLNGLTAQGVRPFEEMSVADARATVASFVDLQAEPRPVAQVIDTIYPGPAGDQDIRLYIPDAPGPLPVVAYFHGGGFVTGDLAVTEELCRALANDAGAIVAAVSYRLAPEHPFPAATDDTFAALRWIADNAVHFGGDPTRIAVHGDSAGGNLAAVAALRARDEGGPALTCQVLTYPVIDPHADTPSREEFGEGYIITAAGLDWFWNHYLRDPDDAENPLAVPSKAAYLTDLPPALILSMEYEVSRDEAESYGRQLADAGVEVEVVRIDGLVHGVYWISGAIPRATEIRSAVAEYLIRQFSKHPAPDREAVR